MLFPVAMFCRPKPGTHQRLLSGSEILAVETVHAEPLSTLRVERFISL
jgi:hypothetical protein